MESGGDKISSISVTLHQSLSFHQPSISYFAMNPQTLAQRWQQLWQALGKPAPAERFEVLCALYSEPERVYHNLAHIEFCLTQLETVRSLATYPTTIEAAIWFHDVFYDSRRNDNEEASAAWARLVLTEAGINAEEIDRVCALILITKHDAPPIDNDAKLLVDIDLAILGRPTAEFDRYEAAIRQEYAWVPDAQFRAGRSKILRMFLDREQIYHTAPFYTGYEQPARENLQRSLAQLSQ